MGQINDRLRSIAGQHFGFWCPGCECMHHVAKDIWTFDGNYDAPTIAPSLLVTSGHFLSEWKPGDPCWCTYWAEHPNERRVFECKRCHTFVVAGMIQFLSDCAHKLAGQTVPIPSLPESHRDPCDS